VFGIGLSQSGSARTSIVLLIATFSFVVYFLVVVYMWMRFIATGRDELGKL
jgi:hypothetical protein